MGNYFKVNTGSLSADTGRIQESVKSVKDLKEKIADNVQSMSTMWEGTAHQRFQTQYAKDDQSIKELCDILDELVDCLIYARKEYDNCEDSVGDIVRSIRV